MEQLRKLDNFPNLPKDWKIRKLVQLSKNKDAFVSGPFGSNLKVSDYKSEGVPILRLQNIGKGYFIDKSIKYINEVKADELKYHSYIPGDIALAKLGIPIGKTCIIPNYFKSGIITADIVRIRPDSNIVDYKYLEYFLNTNLSVAQLNSNISGATRPRVNLSDVRNIEIPLPPLPTQLRIVSILDQTFAALAKAKENAQRNLQNAKELFESYLQGVFEKNGKHCKEVKLSEIAIDITDGDHMPPPKTKAGIPFITISNINKESLQIDFSDTFNVSKEYYQNIKPNRKPKNGDILYTVTGSYGIPVLVETEMEFCFQRHIGLIRPKESVISKWLFYWILSPQALFQANDTATGTAQKTVSLTALRNFNVPKMTLSEQQTIVSNLDALSAETKRLEAIYQQKLLNLEELKKSVLQKAFSGQLSESGFSG